MTLAEWPRRVAALAQVHVEDPAVPVLAADEEHHVRRVLRAKDGEELVLSDGRGRWSLARVREHGLELASDVGVDPAPPVATLYLAPIKGDRGDWAIAKAAEVGLWRVVPLVSERTVVKLRGEGGTKVVARWRRIAREASGQCRRTHDLWVDEPCRVADVPVNVAVAALGASGDWRGVRDVAVGPEGGWAPQEWGSEHRRVGLGPTVLRAETAGVLAAALLTMPAGGWGFAVDGGGNE